MDDNTIINSLNLNKVYIHTSGSSASASEMVINGLSPFINVIQVGQTTSGKNVGGLAVVYDYIDNTNGTANPDAVCIILYGFSVANSEGFSDYANGLSASDGFTLAEDFLNMGVLGEVSDPLFALALNDIDGNSARIPIIIPKFAIENIIEDPDFLKCSMLFMFQGDIP